MTNIIEITRQKVNDLAKILDADSFSKIPTTRDLEIIVDKVFANKLTLIVGLHTSLRKITFMQLPTLTGDGFPCNGWYFRWPIQGKPYWISNKFRSKANSVLIADYKTFLKRMGDNRLCGTGSLSETHRHSTKV